MNPITIINHKDQRVLTSQQLAESFGTEPRRITENFNRNFERFTVGIHYFRIEGEELKRFKESPLSVAVGRRANSMFFWTKRGAARHAKLLETDEAWMVYEELEESYFNQKVIQYKIPQTLSEALRLAADMAERNEALTLHNAQQNQIICEMKPKVTYYDVILQSKAAISITKIAKDYGMSAVGMNNLLHDLKVQFKNGDTWLLYQDFAAMGYTTSKTHCYTNRRDEYCSKLHTYWTQKGRLFIYDLLKSKRGIVPLMERSELALTRKSAR